MKNEKEVLEMKLDEIKELQKTLNNKEWRGTDQLYSFKKNVRSAIIDLVDDKTRCEKFTEELRGISFTPGIFFDDNKSYEDIQMEVEAFNNGISDLKDLLVSLIKYFERLIKYSNTNKEKNKNIKDFNLGDCTVNGDGNLGNLVGHNNNGNTFNIINISNDDIKYTKEAREELTKCDIDEPVKESLISELDKIEIAKKTGKSTTEHIGSFLKIAAPYIGCISNVIGLVAKL